MLKDRRFIIFFLAVLTFCFCYPGFILAADTDVSRIYGSNRYRTAAKLSEDAWEDSNYVVLATGEDFPDALTGVPLSKAYSCPLLLTESDELSSYAEEEINRLEAETCFILGGTGAISADVVDEILDNTTVTQVIRIGGEDRY
ncbi:MAG: cell wall-binding repeat-containing protein, partial [Actinomycetia bacterium]|nr:cell wall-binding repeat-containing protein [Actinomycetes bacterium]